MLLTGCTAQQISPAVHERVPTFAGLVHKALVEQGADVVWTEPVIEMDEDFVSMFDSVVVGLVSPASLAANHLYPALAVARAAHNVNNLLFLLDSPEPHKVWSGILSVVRNKGTLVKDFYARRRSFQKASSPEVYKSLQGFLETLTVEEWPSTIFPTLPWSSESRLLRHIPNLSSDKAVPLQFDRGLDLPLPNPLVPVEQKLVWYADNSDTEWVSKLANTLTFPIETLRKDRYETSVNLAERLRGSIGTLATTYRSGEPWWTPLISLSLLNKVPVVSDWRHTYVLGEAWRHLASSIEQMSFDEREQTAKEQFSLYIEAVPEFSSEASKLVTLLKIR